MLRIAVVLGLSAIAGLALSADRLSAQSGKPQSRPQGAAPAPALWPPVDPAELAQTDAKVEKGADAEAMLWDTRVADGFELRGIYTEYRYAIRIKIFTDRGRDQYATVTVPFAPSIVVSDIAGRTVRPDGSTVELKPSDIFERTVAKIGDFSWRAKTFVLPAVEKGSIIEYRYTERHLGLLSDELQLFFQHAMPVVRSVLHIKPLAIPGVVTGMQAQWYHATPAPFTRESDGYMMTSQTNLPAFHDEPYMPPAAELQPWLFIYYVTPESAADTRDPSAYWLKTGKFLASSFKLASAKLVTPDITRAAEPVRAAPDLDGKIAAALDITRTATPLAAASPALRNKYKPDQTPIDTLKHGVGNESQIRTLFVALAMAGGLEVKAALGGNRESLFMDAASANVAFLPTRLLAVRFADAGRFIDPTNRYSPNGSARWQQESEPVLVGDDSNPGLVRVPLSGAYLSVKTRSGTLRLLEDGTIEGELGSEFAGHFSAGTKEAYDQVTQPEWEKGFKEAFTERMSGAEITGIKFLGTDSAKAPYGYSLHLKMPGYAQRTGTRMFVKPAVFEYGDRAVFTAALRTNPIYFPFPWTERDTVTLTLPPGYEFEDAASLPSVKFGDHAAYEYVLTISPDRHEAVLKRTLVVCNAKQILFSVEEYQGLKRFFDLVVQDDGFALSVRKAGGE
jgi:hypothetical protein